MGMTAAERINTQETCARDHTVPVWRHGRDALARVKTHHMAVHITRIASLTEQGTALARFHWQP
jgi:ribosomal protein L18E